MRQLKEWKLEPVWYPGTKERYDKWVDAVKAMPDACQLTILEHEHRMVGNLQGSEERLPFAVCQVDDDDASDHCLWH